MLLGAFRGGNPLERIVGKSWKWLSSDYYRGGGLRKVIFPSRVTDKSSIYLVSQGVIFDAFIQGKPTLP
jgi:hypothetical protein